MSDWKDRYTECMRELRDWRFERKVKAHKKYIKTAMSGAIDTESAWVLVKQAAKSWLTSPERENVMNSMASLI